MCLQPSFVEVMFSKATANFVHQIDPEGSLIHVSRVNDSKKLVPIGLVVKRNRIWFWQSPKYQPTVFTLSDLLQGDQVLCPGKSAFTEKKGIEIAQVFPCLLIVRHIYPHTYPTSHVLSGLSETDFLTYKGTFRDAVSGKLDSEVGPVGGTLEGQGSSELQSCFGRMLKEELDVKKLLRDSSSRSFIIYVFKIHTLWTVSRR